MTYSSTECFLILSGRGVLRAIGYGTRYSRGNHVDTITGKRLKNED